MQTPLIYKNLNFARSRLKTLILGPLGDVASSTHVPAPLEDQAVYLAFEARL